MSKSNYPSGFTDGVIIRGIPVSVTNPGETFFVSNSSVFPPGGRSGDLGTYYNPCASLTVALGLCTANRGDIILIKPGYTETVTGTDLAISTVAGVAIVGMGSGGLKPTFTSDATGSLITCAVNNVSLYNLRFVATVAAITSGLSISGEDFSIDSCEFMSDEAADGFLIGLITTADAMGLSVTNCTFNMESTVAGVAVSEVATAAIRTLGDRSFIAGNHIQGSFSDAAIENVGTAILGASIIDNDIYNINVTAASFIAVAAGSTGLIMKNMGASLFTTTPEGALINPAMAMSQNFIVGVLTETGGVVGTSASG